MEIRVSKSMSHMLWNLSVHGGRFLVALQKRKYNDSCRVFRTFTSKACFDVEGGINGNKINKTPLPLPLRVQCLLWENVGRLQACWHGCWRKCAWCVPVHDTPAWWCKSFLAQRSTHFTFHVKNSVTSSILITKDSNRSLWFAWESKCKFQATKNFHFKQQPHVKLFTLWIKPATEDVNI